jgi:hypothetical protein
MSHGYTLHNILKWVCYATDITYRFKRIVLAV